MKWKPKPRSLITKKVIQKTNQAGVILDDNDTFLKEYLPAQKAVEFFLNQNWEVLDMIYEDPNYQDEYGILQFLIDSKKLFNLSIMDFRSRPNTEHDPFEDYPWKVAPYIEIPNGSSGQFTDFVENLNLKLVLVSLAVKSKQYILNENDKDALEHLLKMKEIVAQMGTDNRQQQRTYSIIDTLQYYVKNDNKTKTFLF